MSTLINLRTTFQKLAEGVTGKPSRDALVAERDALLASPPPAPAGGMLNPPAGPGPCSCPHCTTRADEERALRVTRGSWEARVRTIENSLVRLTQGAPEDCDEAGQALAELCDELL